MSHWEDLFASTLRQSYGFETIVFKIKGNTAYQVPNPVDEKGQKLQCEYPKWRHWERWVSEGIPVERLVLSQFMFDTRPKGERRQWRFDFCVPSVMLAMEIHGGTNMGQGWRRKKGQPLGGHNTAEGMRDNCEKACVASVQGWTVMTVTEAQIKSGEAMRWFHDAFHARLSAKKAAA